MANGILTLNANNVTATLEPTNQEITLNEPNNIPVGECELVVKANSGYEITRAYYYNARKDEDVEMPFSPKEFRKSINVLSTAKYEYTLETKQVEEPPTETTEPTEPNEPPESNNTTLNKIYEITVDNLKSISNERFQFKTGNPDFPIENDLGIFILNVLEIPFKIDDSFKGNLEKITLGLYELETKGITIKSDEISFDLGTIIVPQKFNNSFDYQNTDVRLNLPYVDSIILDSEYVVGYEIKVTYLLDVYSGKVDINIFSSKTNKNIYSSQFSLGRTIPFITRERQVQGDISDSKGLSNGINRAFIEVARNVPLGNVDKDIEVTGKLLDVKGYVKINDIRMETTATSDEKDLIKQRIREGVIIL